MLRIPNTNISQPPAALRGQAAGPEPNMVFSYQYQATLTSLLQDYLVDLCREYLPYTNNLEIDGVVCLSDGRDLSRQIVLKVHKNLEPLPQAKRQSWQNSDSKWSSRVDLPPKEQIPPNWQNMHGGPKSTQSWPINIDRLKSSANTMGSLSKQVSLYGADAPQDLSLKDPNKGATSTAGLTHLSALANSVQKTPFGTYSNPGSKPAALQPINKNVAPPPMPQPKVVSLLYQKIMEGPKGSAVPMWKSSNERERLSPQNLTASEVPESQHSPGSDDSKDGIKEEEDDDPRNHTGEMLCKICSESVFGGFAALQNHTYEVHRRYVCKKCYSTFSLRCNLRRHERLHEGLKPYSCDSCDKTFSRSTDLRMHMQKHGGSAKGSDAVISCDKCTKSFTNVQNLRWHMYKVHKSQEELWACTICEQLFSDKDEYHIHRESHTASLNQYNLQPNKRARVELEDSGFDHSQDGLRDDESVMRDEYHKEIKAIDEEARKMDDANEDSNTELSNQSDEVSRTNRPSSNPTFSAIKQALASKQSSSSMQNGSSRSANNSRNKRKRKGNPIKHVINGSESDEEVYNLTLTKSATEGINVETVNPGISYGSPTPSTESDMDPLRRSYNSDVLASSSMSQLSHISEQEPMDHLQSLHAMSQIRSPLVIEPQGDISGLALPKSSELLYSPHCSSPLSHSPMSFINNNNNVEDLSTSGKFTPEYKFDPDSPTPLPPVDDGDDEKEYTCSYEGCGDILHGFRAYENHFVSIHSRYPCKLCKQTFSGKNNRTRHMRNHNRAKIYPCPDCGKYFSRPDSMREHRFIHTSSYQEDKCRRCGQEFQRKSLLLAHLKNCFRSARTKNGSIDESPYMYKSEVGLNMKMESLGNSFTESPKSLGHGVNMKMESLGNSFSENSEDHTKSLVSLGQVDMSSLAGSDITRIASVPLNIPKVPMLLNENNNEMASKSILSVPEVENLSKKHDGQEEGLDFSKKSQEIDDVPENLSTKPAEDEHAENEEDTSGNLVIDTSVMEVNQEEIKV